jgi:hypothetical protein
MKCQKTFYVKGKTAFRKLVEVNDSGLEKGESSDKISLVFGSTLGRRLLA